MTTVDRRLSTSDYLQRLGVHAVRPRTSPFDPGYDPVTVESHLHQSGHLISVLKISMACWLIANEAATRRKTAAARERGVSTVVGGGPFEVAVAQGQLPRYLDLCADIGFDEIESGHGFTDIQLDPPGIVRMATERGLGVQFELGSKHDGAFSAATAEQLVLEGLGWLEAGATRLVVEARESARGVGLFDADERLNAGLADRLVEGLGLERLVFEAPTKASQFALLDHYGRDVQLSNVRLEELLRVEIYRRGLHSDAFSKEKLRPRRPADDLPT
jgi:phosphosulfolactate synthase